MANFLTPLLDEYTKELDGLKARHEARLNEAVANAQADIFRVLAGLSEATTKPAPRPRSKAKAKRRVRKP